MSDRRPFPISILWAVALAAAFPSCSFSPPKDFILGVDSNYSLAMESEGCSWRAQSEPADLFDLYARQGIGWLRVRIWTGEEGASGLAYAEAVARRGLTSGLKPCLVLFLSEEWADLFKQPAPARWRDLPLDERAEAVRAYSRATARRFRAIGGGAHLYEVGNEIDYGICGVFAGEGTERDNPAWMRDHVWGEAAVIVSAAQAGVLEADPGARFVVHLARWWDEEFCAACFRELEARGVRIDYLGLSYFPTMSGRIDNSLRRFGEAADRIAAAAGRPVIVAECAYPSSPEIEGQFSAWTAAVPGYPLSPEGQRDWIRDFLRFCAGRPEVAGVFYWSPEWYISPIWRPFSLFTPQGEAKPGLGAFRAAR